MRVLLLHNRYGRPSGEEAVVDAYDRMLGRRGHDVVRFERSSEGLRGTWRGASRAFWSGLGNRPARQALADAIAQTRPDVVSAHNVYPLISPLALGACTDVGVPVVLTVHNYRLVCPNGLLYSGGMPCTRCVGGSLWNAVWRRCEGGWAKSAAYAARTAAERRRDDFRRHVTLFATLTEFQRDQLAQAGFPPARLRVVPNGWDDADGPAAGACPPASGVNWNGDAQVPYVAFIGRPTEEKGIFDLFEAARRVPEIRFVVVGHDADGRLRERVPPNVAAVGFQRGEVLSRLRAGARCVVYPSRCYEGMPMGIVEAMAAGRAVIAPRLGGMPELVDDGHTGWLFRPHDVGDFVRALREAWGDPKECERRGAQGQTSARSLYSPAFWAARVEAVLLEAIALAGTHRGGGS